MKRTNAYILIIIVALLAGSASLAEDQRGFVQEVVNLKADDGVSIPAILTYPSAGINTHSPAVIYHHGAGGNPVQGLGAPRFISEPLAAKGYTGLSILSRHSSADRSIPFETATLDVKAAADWLSQLGITDLILVGHSLGSIRNTRYSADTRDPRIKAMIHYAPTADMPVWVRAGFGETRYWQVVDRLTRLVSEGRGDEYVFDTFEVPPPAPPGFERGLLHTAETWLNWWGPTAQTRNPVWFGELEMPLLLVSGDADVFVTQDYLALLKAAAVKSPRVDTLWYEGGVDHIFTSAEERATKGATDWHDGAGIDGQSAEAGRGDGETRMRIDPDNTIRARAADDAFNWLVAIGLGPRPRIQTRLADTVATDGMEQSGIIYQPDGGSDRTKPAFILLHGYGGDVMRSSSRWLGVRLAQAGYTALAARHRGTGANSFQALFPQVARDIAGWVNYLEANGFDRVVLVGHSWGGVQSTYYKVTTGDSRIIGIIYLAPTRDGPDWALRALGKGAYDDLVARAQGIVATGDGNRQIVSADGVMPEPAPPGISYQWNQTANSFLSEWGPDAATVHSRQVRRVKTPILAIAGDADVFVDLAFMKSFTRAAGGPGDYRWYDDGTPHTLKGAEARVTNDILMWLEQRF